MSGQGRRAVAMAAARFPHFLPPNPLGEARPGGSGSWLAARAGLDVTAVFPGVIGVESGSCGSLGWWGQWRAMLLKLLL